MRANSTIRETIAKGKIGKLTWINFDHRVNYTGGGWRHRMEYPVLEDMISHHCDAFRYLTGEEPVSVFAQGWNPPWSQFPGMAANHVLITMTSDVHVNYFGTWTSRGQMTGYDGLLKLMGSEGTLELLNQHTLLFYPHSSEVTEKSPEPEKIPILELQHREIEGVIDAFLTALRTDGLPPCHIDDNLRTFALNWAALESCRKGQVVSVEQLLQLLP